MTTRLWLFLSLLAFFLLISPSSVRSEPNFHHYQLFGYDFRYTKHDEGLTFGGHLDQPNNFRRDPNPTTPQQNIPKVLPPDDKSTGGDYYVPFTLDFNKRFPVIDVTTRLIPVGDMPVYPFIDIEQSFAYPGAPVLGTAIGTGLQYRPCDSITIEGFVKPYWQSAPNIMGFYTRFSGMRETNSLYDEPIAPQLITLDGNYGLTTGIFVVYRW